MLILITELKNSSPLKNQWGYDVPVVASCPSPATQRTPCDFAILHCTASLQLDTPLDKCQCASLAMQTWEDAFYALQGHSGQLGSYWDNPEISPNLSSRAVIAWSCYKTILVTDFHLWILWRFLMDWNISEEEKKIPS